MPLNCFSVILSRRTAATQIWEYCFEHKTSDVMKLEDLEPILQRVTSYLRSQEVTNLRIYWQGGEVLTMNPEWFLRPHDIVRDVSERSGVTIDNAMQSNLIGFGAQWPRVISEMFNGQIGSSLDFPNVYRKVVGGTPEGYNDLWIRRYNEAREAGIRVGAIAVLHSRRVVEDWRRKILSAPYIDSVGLTTISDQHSA